MRPVHCIIVCLLFAPGCMYRMVDGGFEYRLAGRVVDGETQQPISNKKIVVQSANGSEETTTDEAGTFETSHYTGISWGYSHWEHSPFPPPDAPSPPKLDKVTIYLRRNNGRLHAEQVQLEPHHQKRSAPAKRWIDLGTVVVHRKIQALP